MVRILGIAGPVVPNATYIRDVTIGIVVVAGEGTVVVVVTGAGTDVVVVVVAGV